MGGKATSVEIIAAADRLFYQQGYARTSFADIADAVAISRGNFYYHFRTKDEILAGVIAARMDKTGAMLAQWEKAGDGPAGRIRCFIQMLINNRADIKRHGCPVGTLTSELAKLGHPAQVEANRLFTLFRSWLRRQFVALGHKADADKLALHLLARSQGVATLANAFHDDAIIRHEVALLEDWLAAIVAGRGTHHAAKA